MSAAVAVAALMGAGWGALLPGLVYRYSVLWPDGEPQPAWRRACAGCAEPLPPWWRPRWCCNSCGTRLGPQWWLTVPLSTGVCALLAGALGARAEPAAVLVLVAFVVLGAFGVLLGLVDAAVLRLPDPLVRATGVAGVVILTVAALLDGQLQPLGRAAAGAAVCGVVYVVFAMLPGSPLGYGDLKLGVVLGFYLGWLGWFAIGAGLLFPPLANAPIVGFLLLTRRAGRKTLVPYGPAMLIGALGAIVVAALH